MKWTFGWLCKVKQNLASAGNNPSLATLGAETDHRWPHCNFFDGQHLYKRSQCLPWKDLTIFLAHSESQIGHLTMAPRKSQKAGYRDDPDAVSLHTTPDDARYADDTPDLHDTNVSPPTYTETTHYVDPADGRFDQNGINPVQTHFAGTSTTRSVFGKNKTRIAGEHVRMIHTPADTDPQYLQEWVEYMSRQAPSPYIDIVGTHSEQRRESDGKKKRVEVTDFRISINLRNYLWPNFRVNDPTMMQLRTVDNGEKTWRGTVFKKRAPGATGNIEVGEIKPTLEEWCHRYCASSSKTRM